MNLTNDEAEFLSNLQKMMRGQTLRVPSRGEKERYPASDLENLREFIFAMQVARSKNENRRNASYLLLYENTPLLRLDTDGQGLHTNADGTTIPPHTPHIHIYDEHERDHNAYLLPDAFNDPLDFFQTLRDFLTYAKVIDVDKLRIPRQGGLDFNEDIHR